MTRQEFLPQHQMQKTTCVEEVISQLLQEAATAEGYTEAQIGCRRDHDGRHPFYAAIGFDCQFQHGIYCAKGPSLSAIHSYLQSTKSLGPEELLNQLKFWYLKKEIRDIPLQEHLPTEWTDVEKLLL
mgnify:CR=1 FL=1